MNFGFYYRPEVNRILFHYAPDTGAAPCCYDTVVSESRIADYIGIAQGSDPGQGLLRPQPLVAGHVRRGAGRRPSRSASTRTYLGVRVFEGALPYAGMQVVPSWGGCDVRGADAGPVRARGPLGAEELGREPPADRARADLPRPARGRLRLLGLLAVEHPRGRLRRLRRRRHRHRPGRRPVGQQRRAHRPRLGGLPGPRPRCPTRRSRRTPTASSRRTPRSSACATRRARRWTTCASLRRDFPGLYGKWGFKDSRQRRTRRQGLAGLPVAGPGDDHGRA